MLEIGTITTAWIDQGAAAYEDCARNKKWRPGPGLVEHLRKKTALRQLRADLENLKFKWDLETYLFSKVGPSTHAAGHYTAPGFLPVCYWKSPRALGWQLTNRSSAIESTSGAAFQAGQLWNVLDTLRGVGVPTASTLLTVWEPTSYTILDVRAVNALADAGAAWNGQAFQRGAAAQWNARYDEYLACCQAIARQVGRDLRTVDRALWQYGG